jgi:hypothetical protein
MHHLLLALFVAGSSLAHAGTVICNPEPGQFYTAKGPLHITEPKLLLVTHVSTAFIDSPDTIEAVQSTIELLKPSYERVYVHTGNFKNYFYPDCDPAYFSRAIIGDISIDLEATSEVVLMGGYYSVCLAGTSISVQEAIHRLKTPKSMKITYVLDGVFESTQGLKSNPLIDPSLPDQIGSLMGGFSFNYADFIEAYAGTDSAQSTQATVQAMLSYVFQEGGVPSIYTFQAHLKNHYWPKSAGDSIDWTIQQGKAGAPVIDLYYVKATDL